MVAEKLSVCKLEPWAVRVESTQGGRILEGEWQILSPVFSRSHQVPARPRTQGGFSSQAGTVQEEQRFPLPSGCGQHVWDVTHPLLLPTSWGKQHSCPNARRETEALRIEAAFPHRLSCLYDVLSAPTSEGSPWSWLVLI